MKKLIFIAILILVTSCGITQTQNEDIFLPLLSGCNPTPTPTLTPTPHDPGKGIACTGYCQEDMPKLNASWYYVWSTSHVGKLGNIPMSRCGEMVDIPSDTEYLLVFNEPNNREPAGCPVKPSDAARLVKNLEKRYPDTYIIVGNVHPYSNSEWGYPMYGSDWLNQFFNAYGRWEMGVGVHSYDRSYNGHLAQWNDYFNTLGRSRDYWLTEFNLTGIRVNNNEFQKLMNGVSSKFDHYSVFSNRKYNSWVPMVDDNGELTSYGEIYADY